MISFEESNPQNILSSLFYFISGKKQKQINVKGLPPVGEPLVNYEIVWKINAQFCFELKVVYHLVKKTKKTPKVLCL